MPREFLNGRVVLHPGDCMEVLPALGAESVDSVVTDPPYHLTEITKRYGKPDAKPCGAGKDGSFRRLSRGFMGKQWDGGDIAFRPELWAEVLRVLKPGGHLLAFSGSRTYHRMACAIEDAGFEIRDQIMWVYGSGFPKSLDVSKAIDRAAGAEREVVGSKLGLPGYVDTSTTGRMMPLQEEGNRTGYLDITAPATDAARRWQGFGTALKPSHEPLVLARKPLIGTVAENVLAHGTGALNVNGCRVTMAEADDYGRSTTRSDGRVSLSREILAGLSDKPYTPNVSGRFPANVIHDGSDEVEEAFAAFGEKTSGRLQTHHRRAGKSQLGTFDIRDRTGEECDFGGDTGTASRFFYTAKADAEDRLGSKHPTVKPLDLIQYLVRLITPPRVVDFVCETCSNPPEGEESTHVRSKLSAMPEAVQDTQQGSATLLPRMPLCGPNDSTGKLQSLQQADNASASHLLLAGMSGEGTSDHTNAPSPTLRVLSDNIQASEGRREKVLFEEMRSKGDGIGKTQENEVGSRLCLADGAGESDGDESRLCDGTPSNNGEPPRKTASDDGNCASHQWKAGRQSDREFADYDAGRTQCASEVDHANRDRVSALPNAPETFKYCSKCGDRLIQRERPGVVLDPFAGTGTTGEAAFREGMRAILIEREGEYQADIERRMGLVYASNKDRKTTADRVRNKMRVDRYRDTADLFRAEAAE